MSKETILAIIAYSLIPLYVIGLSFLIVIIARFQLGLLSLQPRLPNDHHTFSLREYSVVGAVFVLFIIMTMVMRKKGTGSTSV
jgi:hypothetical protein